MVSTFQRSYFYLFYTNDRERRACNRSRIQPMVLQRTYPIFTMQAWVMFGFWLAGMLEWLTLEAQTGYERVVFVALMSAILFCIALEQLRWCYVRD